MKCDYCKSPTRVEVKALEAGDDYCDCPHCTRRLCVECRETIKERSYGWLRAQRAATEVLSVTAAEIVRREFSKTAIRDTFRFVVDEPVQMLMLAGWRTERQHVGWAQRANGQWIQLFEEYDAPVLFSLRPPKPAKWEDRPDAVAYYEKVWKAIAKTAKASGVVTRSRSAAINRETIAFGDTEV